MKQAVLQQDNKIAYTTLQCTETVYFSNVIIDGLDLDVRVKKKEIWVSCRQQLSV